MGKTLVKTVRASRGDLPLDDEIERLARWMDSVFHIPGLGLRFGLDSIIGLVPGVGDTLTSLVSLYILSAASRRGVSRVTMLRMASNIAIDYIVGCVPLVGDAFDVFWKANQKNVELLRRHAFSGPYEQRRAQRSDWLFVGGLILALVALLVGSITMAYYLLHWIGQLIAAA